MPSSKQMYIKTIILFVLFLLAVTGSANAAFFSFEWEAPSEFRTTGFVDTIANTMTVQSWTDLGGNSWTLTSLPRDYTARASDGSIFDVPDTWDGTIGSTWAFIPNVQDSSQTWAEGVFNGGDDFYGWGGYDLDADLTNGINLASSTETTWYAPRRNVPPPTAYTDPNGPVVVAGIIPEASTYAMSAFAFICCATAIAFRKKKKM